MQLKATNSDQSGRVYYEPVLTKITGTSQYRDSQFTLEGVTGFWEQGRDVQVPPAGVLAWFTLAEKPKASPDAKTPYQDIVACTAATDQDKESYVQTAPQSHDRPAQWVGAPTQPSAASPQVSGGSDEIQVRIAKGQAVSLRATVFGSLVQCSEPRLEAIGVTTEQLQQMLGTLNMAINVLDSGRQPTHEELCGPKEDTQPYGSTADIDRLPPEQMRPAAEQQEDLPWGE